MATYTLKHIYLNGAEVQTESAVRDGNGNNIATTYLPKTSAKITINGTDVTFGGSYTSPTATSAVNGQIKVFSDTVQTTAANAVTSTSERTYGIQKNSSGQLVVNVPWTNLYTLSSATNTTLGGIKVGAVLTTAATTVTTSIASRYYPVQIDSAGLGFVNIPWTDTTYTHPSYTANSLGFYKFANDALGHISSISPVTLTDLTGLGVVSTTAMNTALSTKADLDASGKVPQSQLPSYVDDVIEGYYYNSKFYSDSSHTTEITGEAGKIYVDLSTEIVYRWSGTIYVEISSSLALGETSSTAYAGDKGAANASNITTLQSYFSSGVAKSASKLTTDAGSSTQPVYFSNGIPVACSLGAAALKGVDTAVTASSTNLITSGAVASAISGYATDTLVLHKAGAESITGVKTFSASTLTLTKATDSTYTPTRVMVVDGSSTTGISSMVDLDDSLTLSASLLKVTNKLTTTDVSLTY
jgi:hypothetical protein